MADMPSDGISLARSYWRETVGPLLASARPDLPVAAARLGTGSDVLGLDDLMSRDHDWGLRLQVVVPADAVAATTRLLDERLPATFAGHPVRLAFTGQDDARLALDVLSVEDLVAGLGFDPREEPTALDWLSLSGQAALEVTAGEVFADPRGELTALRTALAWYPDDVWRHVVAADWARIDEELPLLGRAGDRGDDLGSRVIAARLVDVAVHLGFLLCRRWAPYSKWRGTLFSGLPLDPGVGVLLADVLAARDWRSRGSALAAALDLLAERQGSVGLPVAMPACVPFWDRPYLQVDQGLVDAVRAGITDPVLAALPAGLGGVEQRTDTVAVLVDPRRRRAAVDLVTPSE